MSSIGGIIKHSLPFLDIGGDDLAKLIIFRYWGDEIGSYEKFSTSMKYVGGDAARLLGGIHCP